MIGLKALRPFHFHDLLFPTKYDNIGRVFYAKDVQVVQTHLTSEMLRPSGMKTRRIKVNYQFSQAVIMLKKQNKTKQKGTNGFACIDKLNSPYYTYLLGS